MLVESMPRAERSVLVHGDYRFDNVILSDEHRVHAVLDWELSTLGDPYSDLGVLLAYWTESDDELGPLERPPSSAPGFGGRLAIVDTYERVTASARSRHLVVLRIRMLETGDHHGGGAAPTRRLARVRETRYERHRKASGCSGSRQRPCRSDR